MYAAPSSALWGQRLSRAARCLGKVTHPVRVILAAGACSLTSGVRGRPRLEMLTLRHPEAAQPEMEVSPVPMWTQPVTAQGRQEPHLAPSSAKK